LKPTAEPIRPAEIEFVDGGLRSKSFDDSYFMLGQGLAESQAVFIAGNRLAERFAQLRPHEIFLIGENGFGSGLNALLAADCFEQYAHDTSRLRIFSTEKHPLHRADLERALAAQPSLGRWAKPLLQHYPPPVPGYHRVNLSDQVELILMYGDSESQWRRAQVRVDAWFLDGFAPSQNPEMWSSGLLNALGKCSKPGATLSTFTAVGAVRRGLVAAGFEVEKIPGFGSKRHRLQARWPDTQCGASGYSISRTGTALVIGAGLAGASSARALAERGWQVLVIDREGPASGASGNHAGVVYTSPSSHLTAQNRFYQTAFVRTRSWFERYGFPNDASFGRLNDVAQWPTSEKHRDKLLEALRSGAWPDSLLSQRDDGSFVLHGGGYVQPAAWIGHLLKHPKINFERGELRTIHNGGSALLTDGRAIESDAVILCLAHHTATLPGLEWLFIKKIRGQVSECALTPESAHWQQAICHGGYLTPSIEGRHCVGATYDLKRIDHGIDPKDDQINLDQLNEFLPQQWTELGGENIELIGHRVAVRCQSPDFLPQAGPLADPTSLPHTLSDRVYLNIGHGSRGLTHTPLTADLLADQISDLSPSIEPELVEALAPERFVLRKRRRDPNWRPVRPSGQILRD